MFDIKEQLKLLPEKPGVYMHKDVYGNVIYVGKAISLKNRVRSYFQSQSGMAPKVRAMVSNIVEFEYITTDSEMEALILECNLIKKYMPKYNVLLRDDKTYPYIKVTLNEEWPRIVKTRTVKSDGCKYFGPYSDVRAVNDTIDLLNSIYELKKCSAKSFPLNHTPCLNFHIEKCKGICVGKASHEKYMETVNKVMLFLQGKDKSLVEELRQKMVLASEAMNYERAAEYRDMISAVEAVQEKQKVVLTAAHNMDLVLVARGTNGVNVVVFFVRGGKLSGRESYLVDADIDDTKEEITGAFIKQYYSGGMIIPNEIAVANIPEEKELIEEMLSSMRGTTVKLIMPQKGEKHALMEMAKRDVSEMIKTIDDRVRNQQEKYDALTSELNRVFGSRKSWRIEAYDISNTAGTDSVGGMVVFQDGRPSRSEYRKFKIKTIEGPDDYGSLQEVMYRRLKHEIDGDRRFGKLPDLMLIDGGEKQVGAVSQVAKAMGVEVLIAGMVKDDKHRTRGLVFRGNEIDLKERPVLFRYIGTIQEEVHRFSIEYHKGLRGKHLQKSILDEIPGIGAKRRNALLRNFGSIEKIKDADVEELAEIEGMNAVAARKVLEFLNGKTAESEQKPPEPGN